MNQRKAIIRSFIVVIIIILSIIIGFITQSIITSMEKKDYPKGFNELVEKYAYDNGIPEYVVYSVIKVESNFDSGSVDEDGAIGLMKLTPKVFNSITSSRLENLDNAMLYDPETNVKYGCIYLHNLYVKYGEWSTVYAAYDIGQDTVDEWLLDETLTDKNGKLNTIPDKTVKNYVNELLKANEKYKELY